MSVANVIFQPGEGFARQLDSDFSAGSFRGEFHLPTGSDGSPLVYLSGHSLGLEPVRARALVERELDDWAKLALAAHFRDETPWYTYHETLRDPGARLVGGRPHEVVFMNSLTVNLHLLMATFYRPRGGRRCILTDEPSFPSDLYALQSQIRLHGDDPDEALFTVRPRSGEHTLRVEDIEEVLERRGSEIAVVWWNAVNFLTGEFFDVPRLVAAARRHGCLIGLDLSHAAGNVPLSLHDWDVDFAVWCTYKYLNGGPGAIGGCFIHERHGRDTSLPRLAGWWGNDPDTRFRMQLEPRFVPKEGADGWQVSNPPILAMAPLRASLALFDRAGMTALRQRSERLTGYLLYLLDRLPAGRFEVITPREPARRGCQLSLLVHERAQEAVGALESAGVVCDFREPNVIRAAPAPLYNTFRDVWTFADVLGRL
jgi:kynureninase